MAKGVILSKSKERLSKFLKIGSFLCIALLSIGYFLVIYVSGVISLVFSIIIPTLVFANVIFLVFWGIKKKKYFYFHLLSIALYFFFFDFFWKYNSEHSKNSIDSLTFLSFNVRGFRSNIDKGNDIISFARSKDPDILAFQEFSRDGFVGFTNYPYKFIAYRDKVPKSLLAIYSKYRIINKGYVNFEYSRNGAIFADIIYKDEIIRVYNVHLQSFGIKVESIGINKKRYLEAIDKVSRTLLLQKEQAIKVANHSKSFKGKSIICGDFNSTQFSYTYKVLCKGRNDTFMERGSGFGATYNLFDYPIRLDFILPDLSFDIISHQNFKLKLSDHEPIFVELALKK